MQLESPLSELSDTVSRVFLSGKVHVEYRRILNMLFTRKALR